MNTLLTFLDMVMLLGILCFAIAIGKITKSNKLLHEKNRRERQRESSWR